MAIELYRPWLTAQDLGLLPHWFPGDTPDQFQQQLTQQSPEWPWRSQPVHYSLNSQGYRSGEFDSVDWSSTVVCFGCSFTFGLAVDDQQTWPWYFTQLTGWPTINLGQAGTSVQFSWANSLELIAQGIKPRAVIYYWPDPSRSCEFLANRRVINCGPHREPARPFVPWQQGALGWSWCLNSQHHTTMAQLMIASLEWSCPRLDLTWSPALSSVALLRRPQLDRARDGHHPGPRSNRQFALEAQADLKLDPGPLLTLNGR